VQSNTKSAAFSGHAARGVITEKMNMKSVMKSLVTEHHN
jgi:hypothetical protein